MQPNLHIAFEALLFRSWRKHVRKTTAAFTTYVFFFNSRQLRNLLVITTAQINIGSLVLDCEHVSNSQLISHRMIKNFEFLMFLLIHDWLVLAKDKLGLIGSFA